ncbi:MAG TPA: hypothetical protein PLD47_12140 [Aggregatilineales bacterium]|nr:hypothetical protein [Anaerolineales bacterium]HRE48466.1 hypothetical protein [Aggregatilineales bacterium]
MLHTMRRQNRIALTLLMVGFVAVLGMVVIAPATLHPAAQGGSATPTPFAVFAGDPRITGGSIQRFQFGYMVWAQDTRQIYVLVDSSGSGLGGSVELYSDTWAEGMTDTDPSLVPPPGQQQPIRGFGKVWRETSGLRDRLGFAWNPSQAFTLLIHPVSERTYLSTSAGWVIKIVGSAWQRVDVWNLGNN